MINVIASISVKTGKFYDYLVILRSTLQAVRKEKGCIGYIPTVDIDAKLPSQALDKNVVTILEQWENLEALHAHLGSPHMQEYRERVKNLIESVSLKVLQEVN